MCRLRNRLGSAALVATIALMVGCSASMRRPVEGEKLVSHTVGAGETLESIAEDYYGDPDRAREIARANDVDEDDPLRGRVLRIPVTPEEMAQLERRERARAPYNEGLEMVARGSYLDAARRFRRALEVDPRFADAHYNLGVTYQHMKSYESAAREFREAVRMRPKRADYRYALGGAYFHMERYRDAIEWFEKALRVDPRHLKAQYSLAVALERSGRPAKARHAWRRYLELDDSSDWAETARKRLELLE